MDDSMVDDSLQYDSEKDWNLLETMIFEDYIESIILLTFRIVNF